MLLHKFASFISISIGYGFRDFPMLDWRNPELPLSSAHFKLIIAKENIAI